MDVDVIRRAQQGDRTAIALVVDEFLPTVLGAAYGHCGNWDLASDIAQETFATMLVRIGEVREPAALPGWLMAVVRSAARHQRRPIAGDVTEVRVRDSPDELVVARDEARRTRRAVEALPAKERLPLSLHYFAGCSLGEIAELCDLPLSTVKKRMRVARARLRKDLDEMAESIERRLAVRPSADPSDVIRLYTAMRAGDTRSVAALLTACPEIVEAQENWSRSEGLAHRLPPGAGGTPLLRAVERGDLEMVRLLLAHDADPNGTCTCDGGESPLWVASQQGEDAIVDELLAAGAAPGTTAFAGLSALDVALMRGHDRIVARLIAAGATPTAMPAPVTDPMAAVGTGIRAIDLWCPFPERGLVHMSPGFGLGAIVLIAELSARFASRGHGVVWTGFSQAPTDHGDLHHVVAQSGLHDVVVVSIAPANAPYDDQMHALDRGIALAGKAALLVVFEEHGRAHAIDERLHRLARRQGVTLVIGPLDGGADPPVSAGSPYFASIRFDSDRARRRQWPAISSASWSKITDPRHTALATLARHRPSDELEELWTQPFVVAEPFTGRSGESTSMDELLDRVAQIIGSDLC
jgi:RNA polymerase sigma-70 factor (ECF subfamily)